MLCGHQEQPAGTESGPALIHSTACLTGYKKYCPVLMQCRDAPPKFLIHRPATLYYEIHPGFDLCCTVSGTACCRLYNADTSTTTGDNSARASNDRTCTDCDQLSYDKATP
jgi:hypothetical protein